MLDTKVVWTNFYEEVIIHRQFISGHAAVEALLTT